jgi:predicted ATP-dependent endonuclease of OLD family
MIIKSAIITNYHSCRKTRIVFDPQLTALIGINGSGKTSILRALLLLKNAFKSHRYYRSLSSTDYIKSQIILEMQEDEDTIILKADIYYAFDEDLNENVVFSTTKWKINDLAGNEWMDIPIEVITPNNQMAMFEYNAKKIGINALTKSWYKYKNIKNIIPNNVYDIISKVITYILGFNYYSATQFSDPGKCPSSIEVDNETQYRRMRSNIHYTFLQDLYNLKNNDENTFLRYLALVNKKGIGLISDIKFQKINISSETVDIKISGFVNTQKRQKIIIIPKIKIGYSYLSPSQLSEGTFKTLALIFYAISTKSSFIMIEEPEVCVHHGLLNSIIEIIKAESKYKQIALSTHSDYVLDRLIPENVVLINKEELKGTTTRKLSLALTKNGYKAMHEYLESSGSLGEYWKEGGLDNA